VIQVQNINHRNRGISVADSSEYQPSEQGISVADSESTKSSKSQSDQSVEEEEDKQKEKQKAPEEPDILPGFDTNDVNSPLGIFVEAFRPSDFHLTSSNTYETILNSMSAKVTYDEDNETFIVNWFNGDTIDAPATPGMALLLLASFPDAKLKNYQTEEEREKRIEFIRNYGNAIKKMIKSGSITENDIDIYENEFLDPLHKTKGAKGVYNRKKRFLDFVKKEQKGKGVRDKYKGKAPARLPAKQKGSGKKPDLIHSASNNTLKKRMEVLQGSILAGNNNPKTVNELLSIADTLHNKKAISKKKHREAYSVAGID